MKSHVMKLLIVLCILFLAYSYGHKCRHKEFQKKIKVGKVDVRGESERFLQDAKWESIRIYVDYTTLDSQKTSENQDLINNLKKLIDMTVDVFEKLVMVKRLTNLLILQYCEDAVKISTKVSTTGVEADLIIFPYLDLEADDDLEASAGYCQTEEGNGRPFAGSIGFGKNLDFSDKNAFYNRSLLTIHEIYHILGFDSDLYKTFIDENGKILGEDRVVGKIDVNGKTVNIIKTPKVVETARKFFDCPSLEGVELEDQGGDGTAGSHWESRIMYSDFMTGRTTLENVLSEISLALLEDMGWYKVNYYTGGLFRYGKNKGCEFLNSKCVKENGESLSENEFPMDRNIERFCFAGRTGKGVSSIEEYEEEIPEIYRYFQNPKLGGQDLSDFCPVPTDPKLEGWYDPGSCLNGYSDYVSGLGETIGDRSACFYSSLTKTNNQNLINFKDKTRGICHEYTCDYSTKTYKVKVLDKTFKCEKDGGTISVDGFDGKFWCADFYLVCTKSAECGDVIDCVNKKSLSVDLDLNYNPEDSHLTYAGSFNSITKLLIISLIFIFA